MRAEQNTAVSSPFLDLRQQCDQRGADSQSVIVTPEEWPAFREAIERLLEEIRTAESAELSRNP